MPLESVFDEITLEQKKENRRKRNRKLVWILVIATAFNLFTAGLFSGIFGTRAQTFLMGLLTFGFTFNFLGLVAGSLIALIPYKSLSYKARFVRCILLSMLAIQLFFALMVTINIILYFAGMDSMFSTPKP